MIRFSLTNAHLRRMFVAGGFGNSPPDQLLVIRGEHGRVHARALLSQGTDALPALPSDNGTPSYAASGVQKEPHDDNAILSRVG